MQRGLRLIWMAHGSLSRDLPGENLARLTHLPSGNGQLGFQAADAHGGACKETTPPFRAVRHLRPPPAAADTCNSRSDRCQLRPVSYGTTAAHARPQGRALCLQRQLEGIHYLAATEWTA